MNGLESLIDFGVTGSSPARRIICIGYGQGARILILSLFGRQLAVELGVITFMPDYSSAGNEALSGMEPTNRAIPAARLLEHICCPCVHLVVHEES